MPIPDFQSIMLPLLKFSSDEKEHKLKEAVEALANEFNLTLEERQQMLATGSQTTIHNRVSWSKTYLLKAGLLESPQRSYFKITKRGKNILAQNPSHINMTFLKQFPEYIEFVTPRTNNKPIETVSAQEIVIATPAEMLEASYQSIRRALAQELLDRIRQSSPAFFEHLVVELLVKMGYGGSLKDAGQATQMSGDGGIDGIIKEDKLGLDVIYIQAKKWDTQTSIHAPQIQAFSGALDGKHATKGVFITTAKFSEGAKQYVSSIAGKKIILIDGEQLADYMIDYGLGVSNFATYELKKIDNDYFGE